MQGHLPLLLRAAPAPDVVHIGFGSGGTAWAVSRHPVATINIVEIGPAVLATSDRFPTINHGVLGDPRVTTTIADGRNFLLASGTVLLGAATWLETFDTLLALRPDAPPTDYLAALDAAETARTHEGWASRGALLRAHRDSLATQLAADLRARMTSGATAQAID